MSRGSSGADPSFGLARPQMQPQKRLAWAALWSVATAAMAVAFYYLVAKPTI